MIFDGEKKVYILSEKEYDKMFDGEAHANIELIKVRNQLQEANQVIKAFRKENGRYGGEFIGVSSSYSCAQSYLDKWGVK